MFYRVAIQVDASPKEEQQPSSEGCLSVRAQGHLHRPRTAHSAHRTGSHLGRGGSCAELFWGLRGGGGNFGVATAFEVDLHPAGTVLGGAVFYDIAEAEDILQAYTRHAAAISFISSRAEPLSLAGKQSEAKAVWNPGYV
jgi:FAD/FMN-containing dehydrogenase